MIKISALVLSTSIAFAAAAQAQTAQLPTPANPNPAFPVATDGSPLPHHNADTLYTGRSAFAPVDGVLGAGTQAVGAAINVVPTTVDALTGR